MCKRLKKIDLYGCWSFNSVSGSVKGKKPERNW